MTTPTITPTPSPLPNRSQDKVAFNNAVDSYMTWLEANADELALFIPWVVQSRDQVIAAALAGNLPSLVGQEGKVIYVDGTGTVNFEDLVSVPPIVGGAGGFLVGGATDNTVEVIDAAAARTALGLGTAATENLSNLETRKTVMATAAITNMSVDQLNLDEASAEIATVCTGVTLAAGAWHVGTNVRFLAGLARTGANTTAIAAMRVVEAGTTTVVGNSATGSASLAGSFRYDNISDRAFTGLEELVEVSVDTDVDIQILSYISNGSGTNAVTVSHSYPVLCSPVTVSD